MFFNSKKLAVLGDQVTGKTVLLNLLTKGILGEVYPQTLSPKTNEARHFQMGNQWISFKESYDVGGDDSFYGAWEYLFKESDLVFYLVRADLLINKDERTEKHVENDLSLIQIWRKKYDLTNKKDLLIVCTFCDQIEQLKSNIPRRVEVDELSIVFPLLYRWGVGIRVILGSLLTKDNNDNTEKLVKLLFQVNSLTPEAQTSNRNMSINHIIPEAPEKCRVIMVLSRQDLMQLNIDAESDNSARELLLNPQVFLLDSSIKNDSPLIQKIRRSGLLNPGSILIQSPYDPDSYADAVNAAYKFAQDKCIHFTNFCGLLAAKKISVEQMEMTNSEGETKGSGDLDTSVGGGHTEVEKRAWKEMRKAIKIEEEYDQGEPQVEQAKIYLSKYYSDPHMDGLIFKKEAGIPIKKHKFILSLTEESQKNLNVAFDLNIPKNPSLPIIGKLTGNLDQIKKETFKFDLTINVEFW